MSGGPSTGVCILVQQASGVRKAKRTGKSQKVPYIKKGELLFEIPLKDRVKQEADKPPHNYALLRDPEVTLYDNGINVVPLIGPEADYLEGVKDPHTRYLEHRKEDRLKWIMDLRIGEMVYFKLERDKSSKVPLTTQGRIKWYGVMDGEIGVNFGIEITDPEHKGRGYTNGQPYFKCSHRDGVFVSMDKIIKKVERFSLNRESELENVIDQQPTAGGPPAENTRSKASTGEDKKETWYNRAINKVDKAIARFSEAAQGEMLDPSDSRQSKFSPDDRVVVQTVHGRTVTGTVRWVGPIRAADNVKVPAVVGIEVNEILTPTVDFPDIHMDITGSHGQELFPISSGHSRLFLPEALVLYPDEYDKHKQESNTFEAQEAKKWGLGVHEYREQIDEFKKRESERQKDFAEKRKKHEKQHEKNEETGVAGIGDLQDSMPPLDPNRGFTEQFTEERIEQQKKELERIQRESEFKRQGSQDQDNYQYPPADDRLREQPSSLPSATMNDVNGNPSHSSHHGQKFNPPHNSYQNVDGRQVPEGHQLQQYSLNSSGVNPVFPDVPSDPSQFTAGTLVWVKAHNGNPYYGTVKWLGTLPDFQGIYAGVELDHYLEGCSDGVFGERRYFKCPAGRGLFCLASALQLDQRYLEPNQVPAAKRQDYQNPLTGKAPVSEEDDTPGDPGLFSKYIGDEHGIQGHHNSCYLDATVFGLFALSDSFDVMLLEEPETEIGQKIKEILSKGIVNPLRKYGLARFESIMMLRNELENLGRMKGANKDEKDPEEFLNLLFKEILHVHPFISIKRPFGVEEEFFVQLFFEMDPKQSTLPDTEKLIRKMFVEQQISFTSVPSKLLLQMPRFGKEFKMYNKIIPSLELDVKPLLDPASRGVRNCQVCLDVTGTFSCSTCATEVLHTEESSVFLCKKCFDTVHGRRPDHKFEEVQTKRPMADASGFSKMVLLSVICIETSHYVCFTRTKDKWLFHDSMANRLYDTYNIPRVTDVSEELNHWVYNPKNHKKLMQAPSKDVPEYVRRFTQDIYMCVYINPDLDKYGPPPEMSLLSASSMDDPMSPDGTGHCDDPLSVTDKNKPVPKPRNK